MKLITPDTERCTCCFTKITQNDYVRFSGMCGKCWYADTLYLIELNEEDY